MNLLGTHKDNEIWKDFAIFIALIIILSQALWITLNWNDRIQQMSPCITHPTA